MDWIVRIYAKLAYRWRLEAKAAEQDVQADLAQLHADQRKKTMADIEKEIVALEKVEADIAEKEKVKKGVWKCDNGHTVSMAEIGDPDDRPASAGAPQCGIPMPPATPDELKGKEGKPAWVEWAKTQTVPYCDRPLTFYTWDKLNKNEEYEDNRRSKDERKEQQAVIAGKKAYIDELKENIKGGEETAKHFRREAQRDRTVAREIKGL